MGSFFLLHFISLNYILETYDKMRYDDVYRFFVEWGNYYEK